MSRVRSARLVPCVHGVARAGVAALATSVAALAAGAWAPAAAQGVLHLEAIEKPRPTLRSPGKPVAPFTIEHRLSGPAGAGVQFDLELVLRPQTPVNEVTVRLTPGEGLWIEPDQMSLAAPEASPETPVQWRIRVLPLDSGPLHLSVYAEAAVDGTRQGRSVVIAIPIAGGAAQGGSTTDDAVGGGPNEPAAGDAMLPGPDGERVIRMPAQERKGTTAGSR